MRVMRPRCAFVLATVLPACCSTPEGPTHLSIGPRELPAESYEHPPEMAFDKSDYLFKFEQLTHFYDAPGEAGVFMFGEESGFDSLSIIVTETHPHGGPPLHTYDFEEAHVLLSGRMDYVIGREHFSATEPYIAQVPAGVQHTFVNAGSDPLNLIGCLERSDVCLTRPEVTRRWAGHAPASLS